MRSKRFIKFAFCLVTSKVEHSSFSRKPKQGTAAAPVARASLRKTCSIKWS